MFSRGIEMEHWAKIGQNWRKQQLEVFCKKGGLRNFAKFKGKHLCQNLFLYSLSTLLKKRLWHRCFPVNFAKVLRTPFYRTPRDDCFWTEFILIYNWVLIFSQWIKSQENIVLLRSVSFEIFRSIAFISVWNIQHQRQ